MATRTAHRPAPRRTKSPLLASTFLLSVAIVSAALILRGTFQGGESQTSLPERQTQVVAEFDTVAVPVPVEPVAVGTKLQNVRFTMVQYPKHQLPAGAITSLEEVISQVALAPLPAQVPLFRINLGQQNAVTNPVLDQIPAGMRAMTLRVDAMSSVEGWAGAGSIVDVILNTEGKSTVIAERVLVLTAERSAAPVEGSATPNIPSTATILVTQEQCLAINTAIPMGKITFVLRSLKDEEEWGNTSFTSDKLTHSNKGQSKSVNGVIKIKDYDGVIRSFILANGKWVLADSLPEGFFPAEERK